MVREFHPETLNRPHHSRKTKSGVDKNSIVSKILNEKRINKPPNEKIAQSSNVENQLRNENKNESMGLENCSKYNSKFVEPIYAQVKKNPYTLKKEKIKEPKWKQINLEPSTSNENVFRNINTLYFSKQETVADSTRQRTKSNSSDVSENIPDLCPIENPQKDNEENEETHCKLKDMQLQESEKVNALSPSFFTPNFLK